MNTATDIQPTQYGRNSFIGCKSSSFSKASVFYGLLELNERVYIGMTVTFDQIKLNGEVISWNSQNVCSTGVHSNNFLSVNEWNQLHIQEHDNSNYPDEILFFVEDLDGVGLFITS